LHNNLHAMRAIDPHIHPMTKLWRNLSLSPMLPTIFPEFYKLAEMAMIMVLLLHSYFFSCIYFWFTCLCVSYYGVTCTACVISLAFVSGLLVYA
jgi:hypothetical protein